MTIEGDEDARKSIHARFTGQQRENELSLQAQKIDEARVRAQQFENTHAPLTALKTAKGAAWTRDSGDVTKAGTEITAFNKQLESINQAAKDAATALKEFNDKTEDMGTAMVAGIQKSAENAAEKIGASQGPLAARILGTATGANAEVGKQAKAMYKKKMKTSDLAAVMKDLQDENK